MIRLLFLFVHASMLYYGEPHEIEMVD